MDSFELNKIAGAVLACLLVIMGVNQFGNILFHRAPLAEQAFKIEVADAAPSASAAPAAAEPAPEMGPLLASADVEAGKKSAAKCVACHSFEKGGANKVGPNLWNVVGNHKGHVDGFAFSDALKKTPGEWTYENLFAFLGSPRTYAPGTKMSFAGIRSNKERADLLAYLRTLADDPKPLP
ncbi:cytochrome c family protein [Ferrovibrio sp.]|uniref:c-type cytochrome n=1 Tax=Ferrovibrio sp. TaxID=1917215 RepID=UPI0025B8ED8A|nr:cytochrome c family protein [Ferrovibrio sp.]MBX3456532.1 cytochrome c family protein [Ferrovibrio sp.]